MSIAIIIASHGDFAVGLKQTAGMIFGEQERVEAISFMPNEGPNDLLAKFKNAVSQFPDCEILCLVDLWGGTPFNQASLIQKEITQTMFIVSGMNLPMVIQAYSERFDEHAKLENVIKNIMFEAKSGVKPLPELGKSNVSNNASTHAGNVNSSGVMEFVLARVDSRLLHGQVATSWSKEVKPTRIIVVSDNVAKDELRKKLIENAAPPGIKANVVPIDKLVQVSKDGRFAKEQVLLLFETPSDALKVVEKGVNIKEINVGSMAHSVGKVMVNNVLSMSQQDVDDFKKLQSFNITFDVRKVPNDSKSDLFSIISSTKGLKV